MGGIIGAKGLTGTVYWLENPKRTKKISSKSDFKMDYYKCVYLEKEWWFWKLPCVPWHGPRMICL